MTEPNNPLAADFAQQIAAQQHARRAGGSPLSAQPAAPPSPARLSAATEPTQVRRVQRDFLIPAAVADQVDDVGVRWADLIETAWWRHSDLVDHGLERHPRPGEVRVRPSLLADVHAAIKAAAGRRGWSASQLVTALVMRELADRS